MHRTPENTKKQEKTTKNNQFDEAPNTIQLLLNTPWNIHNRTENNA
jgi:hypothetical protein